MSSAYTDSLNQLIEEFGRLPGIGPKSAERLAFHILKASQKEALGLADAIRQVKTTICHCQTCGRSPARPRPAATGPVS